MNLKTLETLRVLAQGILFSMVGSQPKKNETFSPKNERFRRTGALLKAEKSRRPSFQVSRFRKAWQSARTRVTLVRQGTSGPAICGRSAAAAYDVVKIGGG